MAGLISRYTGLLYSLAVLAMLNLLGACGSRQGQEQVASQVAEISHVNQVMEGGNLGFIEGAWNLVELEGKTLKDTADSASLEIYFGETKIYGFAGCNRFFGTVKADEEGQISFSGIATTRMACPSDTIEASYISALGRVKHYLIDRERRQMQLFDEQGKLLLRFEEIIAC